MGTLDMADARKRVGIGQVYVWPGGSLWIGQATGATEIHAHHALQLSFANTGELRLRTRKTGWASFRAAIVPSDVPHAFHGDNIEGAHIFIEPESTTGRRIIERFRPKTLSAIPAEVASPAMKAVFDGWATSRTTATMVPAAQQALDTLAGSTSHVTVTDPRVLGAIEIICSRLESTITLTDVAGAIYVSPSRLRHLFVQETGLPFRRYVLWQRLQKVFAMMTTASLTDAAHAAGFADAAHMTRTFRRMLGIAPSSLEAD